MNIADSHKVKMDSKGRVRKSFSPVRLIGNLLIFSGLALLLGIGGWQGYNWWSNDQFIQDGIKNNGLIVEPTLSVAQLTNDVQPTATVQPAPPPPDLHNVPGIASWVGVLGRPTYDSPPIRLVIPSVMIDT